MWACCCAVVWSHESHSVCLGDVSQIKNFIKRSHVQLLNRRSKERDRYHLAEDNARQADVEAAY